PHLPVPRQERGLRVVRLGLAAADPGVPLHHDFVVGRVLRELHDQLPDRHCLHCSSSSESSAVSSGSATAGSPPPLVSMSSNSEPTRVESFVVQPALAGLRSGATESLRASPKRLLLTTSGSSSLSSPMARWRLSSNCWRRSSMSRRVRIISVFWLRSAALPFATFSSAQVGQ